MALVIRRCCAAAVVRNGITLRAVRGCAANGEVARLGQSSPGCKCSVRLHEAKSNGERCPGSEAELRFRLIVRLRVMDGRRLIVLWTSDTGSNSRCFARVNTAPSSVSIEGDTSVCESRILDAQHAHNTQCPVQSHLSKSISCVARTSLYHNGSKYLLIGCQLLFRCSPTSREKANRHHNADARFNSISDSTSITKPDMSRTAIAY